MKLILKASVPHLGEPGDMAVVKKGYGRNYLIPQGLAIQATESNLRAIGHELGKLKEVAAAKRSAAEALAAKLEGTELSFERKVADPSSGNLYGSVSVADIDDALRAIGFEVNKSEIHLEGAVKNLGTHTVSVTLAHGVSASIKVVVVGEDGETAARPLLDAPAPAPVVTDEDDDFDDFESKADPDDEAESSEDEAAEETVDPEDWVID